MSKKLTPHGLLCQNGRHFCGIWQSVELSFANQVYVRIFFSRCTIVARFGLCEDVKITEA